MHTHCVLLTQSKNKKRKKKKKRARVQRLHQQQSETVPAVPIQSIEEGQIEDIQIE